MKTFLALALLVAVSSAADPPPGYGSSSYGGGYSGPDFNALNQQELINLNEYIEGLAFEQSVVAQKTDALNQAEKDILGKLDDFIVKLEGTADDNVEQTARLAALADRTRIAFEKLNGISARAIGEEAGAQRLNQLVIDFQEQIDAIKRGTNPQQDADIAAANALLDETAVTLATRISNAETITAQDVAKVKKNTDQLVTFVNNRKCYSVYVHVAIDAESNEGTETVYIPEGTFTSPDRPTVFCGVQGFVSDINLDKSHPAPSYGAPPPSYGYASYEDEVQNLAVATLCSATTDTITAWAADQSRGQGNVVTGVYLQVKVCSFAAQAGFSH